MQDQSISLFRQNLYSLPTHDVECKVCCAPARLFGVLDLNRECSAISHPRGVAGVPVYYHQCTDCGLLFTCTFDDAAPEDWSEYIYNDDYYKNVDTEYEEERPRQSFELMSRICRKLLGSGQISGLDYGGGNGRLSHLLQQRGFDYRTHDPYGKTDVDEALGRKANVISAFEVLEHTTDPVKTFADMLRFADDRVLIVASTQVSDGRLDAGLLNWDYIAPRSGHVTIYTRKCLELLARRYSLDYVPVTRGLHLMSRGISAESVKNTALLTRARQLLRAKLRLGVLGVAVTVTDRLERHDLMMPNELLACVERLALV
jgi:hypothetical protein